jgi:hypothetical protein
MRGEEELEPKMCFFVHTVSLRSVSPGMCLRKTTFLLYVRHVKIVNKIRPEFSAYRKDINIRTRGR